MNLPTTARGVLVCAALSALWPLACASSDAGDNTDMPANSGGGGSGSNAENPDDGLAGSTATDDGTASEGSKPLPSASSDVPPDSSSTAEPGSSTPPTEPGQMNTGAMPSDSPSPDSTTEQPSGSTSSTDAPKGSATSAMPSNTAPTPSFDPDDPANIPPGSGPLGVETTCDGVDDDLNGVIDDVDAGGDGVCDCLRVATLGLHGEWGEGDVLQGWFAERTTTEVTALGDADLTAELLAPFQVLIIEDVSTNHTPGLTYSAAEAQVLWDWVRQGGGLLTLIGYSDAGEASNVNALLEPFALSYGSEAIVTGSGAAVPITEWFEHPLSKGVTQVGADNGYPTEGQGTTVAAQDGYDLGKAVIIGDGHVLVWGDEWVTYEAEWIGDSTYQVEQFWRNTFDWLARANECHVPQP